MRDSYVSNNISTHYTETTHTRELLKHTYRLSVISPGLLKKKIIHIPLLIHFSSYQSCRHKVHLLYKLSATKLFITHFIQN